VKERIEQAVAVLVGLPLVDYGRAADMMMFGFGDLVHAVNYRGESIERAEYRLHVQCHWRIADAKGIVVGARDLYYPADEAVDVKDFNWDTSESRLVRRMSEFWSEHAQSPLAVQSVDCDGLGGLRLHLTGGFTLELFPDDSLPDENWRLFRSGDQSKHFVVTGAGIEE
jgi:hypothetical protein